MSCERKERSVVPHAGAASSLRAEKESLGTSSGEHIEADGRVFGQRANFTDDRSKVAKRRLDLVLGGFGITVLTVAASARPHEAGEAASQDWPPFVLVTGLLLIGLVANGDGLFAAAGYRLSRLAKSGGVLFAGAVVMVGLVTAVLNLDTSVAFLTPVLVYTAKSRGGGEAPLLYGCLLLSNAGSLFLPGSNLTNLIVLGNLHLSGASFFARYVGSGTRGSCRHRDGRRPLRTPRASARSR